MRVIAGTYRSRLLVAPAGQLTRPTSDRLRETLFNVLGARVESARFADLFAGSGAVGIEALSRGAAHCLFVERAPPALAALRKNLAGLALGNRATVELRPVARVLAGEPGHAEAKGPYDLLFLDPPYEAADAYSDTLGRLGDAACPWRTAGATVIAEHARRYPLPPRFGVLERVRVLEQSDAALSFYEVASSSLAGESTA